MNGIRESVTKGKFEKLNKLCKKKQLTIFSATVGIIFAISDKTCVNIKINFDF